LIQIFFENLTGLIQYCFSRNYQFTFPNIHFAINCNKPVKLLYAQGVGMIHTEIWSHHHWVHLWLHEKTGNKT